MTESPEPKVDWCRHCEATEVMTFEHLPPKAAGNDQPIRMVSDEGEVLKEYNEGHGLPNLCLDCNNGASRRGLPGAYKQWRLEVIAAIEAATTRMRAPAGSSIWKTTDPLVVDHEYSLHPGRVARHVLGMLLAVQRSPTFIREHPELKAAYFSDEGLPIAPQSLHVALANVDYQYFSDELTMVSVGLRPGAETKATSMRFAAFMPFVTTLVHGDSPPWAATRIDQWLDLPTTYHFRKKDRTVEYPFADRTDLLIGRLYEGSKY